MPDPCNVARLIKQGCKIYFTLKFRPNRHGHGYLRPYLRFGEWEIIGYYPMLRVVRFIRI